MSFGFFLFILLTAICGFIGYSAYRRMLIDKRQKEQKRADKLAAMREAGQSCYNCKFCSKGLMYPDTCERSSFGYNPVTGNSSRGSGEHCPNCRDVVGTNRCGWEKK